MAKKSRANNLRQLQREWYRKLKKTGFVDAEKLSGNDMVLKRSASDAYRQASKVTRDAKQAYFDQMCYHAYQEHFDKKIDELVIKMRAEGANIKGICAQLKKKGYERHQQTVRFIIRKYENRWGVKCWKPKLMTSKR